MNWVEEEKRNKCRIDEEQGRDDFDNDERWVDLSGPVFELRGLSYE